MFWEESVAKAVTEVSPTVQCDDEGCVPVPELSAMRLLLTLVALLTPVMACAGEPGARLADAHAANKKLGRGINLGNALEAPGEGAWGVRLKAEYFTAIKKAGFATVRLPVRWSAHASATAPYAIDPEFARRVDWAADQTLNNDLNINVNVHHYEEMTANPEDHLPRLVALWRQIAARYKDRPAGLYFELLNEPHDRLTEAKWNAAIPKLLAAVRETNPKGPVLAGPGRWNGIDALDHWIQ